MASVGKIAAGSRVGNYVLDSLIAQGGMGAVYRARDDRLDRVVALKILAEGLAADPSFRGRFADESRIAAALDHPHIVPIYEAGESDGLLFIAMVRWTRAERSSCCAGSPAHWMRLTRGASSTATSSPTTSSSRRQVAAPTRTWPTSASRANEVAIVA
jgi:hypothetical protein